MVTASLHHFLLSGNLGEIGAHLNESDVIRLVGPPDDSIPSPIHHAFYGCVHIQYTKAKEIAGLSVLPNDPAFPSGGTAIKIDPWKIHPEMSSDEFTDLLRKERIPYTKLPYAGEAPPRYIVNDSTYAHFDSANDRFFLWSLAAVNPRFAQIADD
jgi:hypothetical protein